MNTCAVLNASRVVAGRAAAAVFSPVAVVVALAAFATLAPTALAQDTDAPAAKEGGTTREAPAGTLDERYFRAFYAENGLRDFKKAAEDYAQVAGAAAAAGNRDLHVKSLLGRGRCMRILDQQDAAREAFAAALVLDPANEEARAGSAAGAPAGDEASLRAVFDDLVAGLGGMLRDQARTDLLRIGARAIPALEENGLRANEVGVVVGSAEVLAQMDAPGARAALARAFHDPAIAFPRVLIGAMGSLPTPSTDADPEGRLALLREILRLQDTDFRVKALRPLVKSGFATKQAPQVAAVLVDFLSGADNAWKKYILGFPFGSTVSRELLPTARGYFSSEDADLRGAALELFTNAPKEMAPEDLAAVRGFLEKGTPGERMSALKILDSRGLLSDAERGAAISSLFDADEATVRRVFDYVWVEPGAGQPMRWSPACVPGYFAGFRKAIDGAYSEDILQWFGKMLSSVGDTCPDDDLIDVIARSTGRPRSTGITWVEQQAPQAAARRWASSRDPEAVSAVFLKGFRRLQGTGRNHWLSYWAGLSARFTPAVLLALAEDQGDDSQPRSYGYSWIGERGARTLPGATPALLANIGRDLASPDANMSGWARSLAENFACPALAPAVRGLLQKAKNSNDAEPLLRLLVKCAGKEAIPDLREVLQREEPSYDSNAVSSMSMVAADLLVQVDGADALPDLLDLANRIDPAMAAGRSFHYKRLTREMFEAFLNRLPVGRRSGAFVADALARVSEEWRAILIQESLVSTDPRILAAAADAIRQFNLVKFWPSLVPLLDSADGRVRQSAQEALDAIRQYRDLKASFERWGENGPPKALDDAMSFATMKEPEKRKAAALALGALGDKAGVATLLRLAVDDDASVREAALGALERMGGRARTDEKAPEKTPAGDDVK